MPEQFAVPVVLAGVQRHRAAYRIEAAGRSLAALTLWRDGRDLMAVPEQIGSVALTAAHPMTAIPAGGTPGAWVCSAAKSSTHRRMPAGLRWHNPESPPATDRLVLRANTTPHAAQVVWYVDGAPFALSDPGAPVTRALLSGEHRCQIGRPLQPGRPRPVRLLVE
jgi:hypothetical protein